MPEEQLLKRVAPNSLEAEQSVVGAMLIDKDAIEVASEIVNPEDFYNRQLGTLFETMVELNREGSAVDVVTLQNRLREKNVPPQVSSVEFIGELVSAVPTSANVKYYAQIVADKSTLRKLIKVSEDTINNCYTNQEDMEALLNDVEKDIFKITQKRSAGDFVSIDQVVMNTLNSIEIASKMKGNVTGLSTGFLDLDYKTAGFHPSELILIAARPAMGKTAFVLNIAEHMAFHDGKCIAIFSLEMSKEQLVQRLLAMESHVDSQHIRTGNMSDMDWEKLIESADVVGGSKLIIDDTPGITIQELRSKCRKYKMEFGLNLIMIDYLQLMSGGGGKSSESRQQEISEISRSLKALARELDVPVIALSQLSRAVESRPDHRPMLSDLRESGAIEQDADMVMFIYRDDYYNKDSEKKGVAEIIIAKQRSGPIGTIDLLWLPEYTKFANMERSH
ncbi:MULTISPECIES: replicative DNA helicase [unclassified Butyrivibrio]|uniref:replicative DNA helicase n=1 Tax=unclassified Butyrivibrio TaxID=2639466 RepID=UPI0003B70301|nr:MULTISPECIES: replicative DNA helicase [unclassified Butyrivibrio]MDC7294571.1 replicative DNA helicase [Butyrivibrio sp. DSM 10294]